MANHDEGTYKKTIEYLRTQVPTMRLVGLSATPFRASTGLIYGEGRLFEQCVARIGMRRLIEEKYLTPIIGKTADKNFSGDSLHMRGGDFKPDELADFMTDVHKVRKAVADIIQKTGGRKQILVFSCGIKHSSMIVEELRKLGQQVESVDGEMETSKRDRILAEFRNGALRILVNAQILTTGYDDPGIDCIVLLRPTRSPGLLLQMAGRGLRLKEGKDNCLLLDFGGCIAEGEPVLTRRGYVPIEFVQDDDELWDGKSWTAHGGVIYKGTKEVITYANITATPDHLFWTEHGWRPFGDCAAEGIPLVAGECGGEEVRDTDGHFIGTCAGRKADGLCSCEMRLREDSCQAGQEAADKLGVVSGVQASTRHTGLAVLQVLPAAGSVREHEKPRLCELRREGNTILVQVAEGGCHMGGAESRHSQDDALGSHQQRRELRAGEPALLDAADKRAAHADQQMDEKALGFAGAVPGMRVSDNSPKGPVSCRAVEPGDSRTLGEKQTVRTARVYDIRDAGERSRFVVRGAIAHNCLSHFGPLDTIEENISTKEKGPPGAAPTKVCPDCDTVLHAAALVCPTCGKTFERNLKHEEKASDAPVLSNEPQIFTITTMTVHRHEKPGKPPTLRLSYSGATGFVIASEWLSISAEADHYAYVKAIKTLADWPGNPFTRLGDTLYLKGSDGRLMPAGFDAILEAARSLRPPKTITTVREGKYLTIKGRNHATQDSQPTG
jgi:uncharacterized Zn finger protein (UPF0148 family)